MFTTARLSCGPPATTLDLFEGCLHECIQFDRVRTNEGQASMNVEVITREIPHAHWVTALRNEM